MISGLGLVSSGFGLNRSLVAPAVLTATIPVAGDKVTVVFDGYVYGDGTGFVLNSTAQGAKTLTYSSGGDATWTFAIPPVVITTDPCTLDYSGAGISSGPTRMDTISAKAVTNNSTQ